MSGARQTACMAVSNDDRRRMARLGRDLAGIETDETPSADALAAAVAEANVRRAERGIPPLADDRREPPEEEFYRRARALGFRRSRG